ncbi:MAG: HEAT repeat domain-containing protein [Polyangiaceae bacterium]
MQRLFRTALFTALVSIAIAAPAKPGIDSLAERLENSDFRVRVQAALELGRSADGRAVYPLVSALDDENASVRAAAAAALGKLGDARGRSALQAHGSDSSSAVRSEVKSALSKIAAKQSQSDEPRTIVVKLGGVHNGTKVKSVSVERDVLVESKKKLDELPNVAVLNEPQAVAGDSAMVKVIPSITKLAASRDGDSIVYSAKVEFILQTMPDETIMARLSGTASAAASENEAQDRVASARLRHDVLSAAIHSALKSAPDALVAAARL